MTVHVRCLTECSWQWPLKRRGFGLVLARLSPESPTSHTNPKRQRGGLPTDSSLTLRVSVVVYAFVVCATHSQTVLRCSRKANEPMPDQLAKQMPGLPFIQ